MMKVRAKKYLGQHFLKDEGIARKIADSLSQENADMIIEIGPGMGVLTKYLIKTDREFYVIEIDKESVKYLEKHYPDLEGRIIAEDFLKLDLQERFPNQQIAVIVAQRQTIQRQFNIVKFRRRLSQIRSGKLELEPHQTNAETADIYRAIYQQFKMTVF